MPLSEQKLLGGRFWGLSGPGPALGSWPPPPGSLSSLTCCFVIAYSELELVRAAWRGREGALSWVWQAHGAGNSRRPHRLPHSQWDCADGWGCPGLLVCARGGSLPSGLRRGWCLLFKTELRITVCP